MVISDEDSIYTNLYRSDCHNFFILTFFERFEEEESTENVDADV